MENVLLETKKLKKYFETPFGTVMAVNDVNIKINEGETLGVVGESGCGKSTLARTILRLTPATDGEVLFKGKNILNYKKSEMRDLRQEMQIIFQDPYSSLNPRMSVEETISEPISYNKIITDKEKINQEVSRLMDLVGLAQRYRKSYPHELDGGRRQRIGIARALALDPTFIVCDEPVSALDVSIQAQILNLLMDLQDDLGLTYMFITHDLSVVKHISNNIAVMYLGKVVENAETEKLFNKPLHPYTQALLSAILVPRIDIPVKREILKGEVSTPVDMKDACVFYPRCKYAKDLCKKVTPELLEVKEGHFVACHMLQNYLE